MKRIALVLLGLCVASPAAAADAPQASRDQLLAEAMKIHEKRDSLMMHKRSASAFSALAKAFPDDRDLQIWCARTAYYAAHRIADSTVKQRVARRGTACARRMLKANPKDYDGQLWVLMTRFKGESASGIMAALDAAKMVKAKMARLIKSDPSRFEAYMILGAIYRELPGPPISFGDNAKALTLLEKAHKLAPDDAEVLLELAQTYAKTDQEDKARATYRKCIKEAKGLPEMWWEIQDAKDYAKKMLADLD